MSEISRRLTAIDERVDDLSDFVHALEASLEKPTFHQKERYFRYGNPTLIHFVLLKSARIVSAFYACSSLCRGGFVQEMYVLLRTAVEYCSQIDYMMSSVDDMQMPSDRAQAIVNDYFADHYESRSNSEKRLKLKQEDVHKRVGSYIDEALGETDRDVPLSKLMSNVYINLSNFVHGRHVECMDLYAGNPGHFHLFGMSGTPKDVENVEVLETYLRTAELCFVSVVHTMNLLPLLKENDDLGAWYRRVVQQDG